MTVDLPEPVGPISAMRLARFDRRKLMSCRTGPTGLVGEVDILKGDCAGHIFEHQRVVRLYQSRWACR